MKIGIVGLGSMGKRRIRNLKALGHADIIGVDLREDRRSEARDRYAITVAAEMSALQSADAIIISTPPDLHQEYIAWSLERRKPCFIELSIVLQELPRLREEAMTKSVLIAPSCTLLFHPAVRRLRSLVDAGEYGKVTDFVYHSGNYLADWHPWEGVNNFFVNDPETSGCRELLAFELNWISHCFGKPRELHAQGKKALGFGLETNDTCAVQISFANFIAVVLVDVVSRFMTRSLTVNFEKAQFRWHWENKSTELYVADEKKWTKQEFELGPSESGYNENLSETIYIDELRAFLDAVGGTGTFPSTLDDDIYNLKLLSQSDLEPALGG